MSDRQRDGHGRSLYADNEIPPVSSDIAIWRGRVTTPGEPYEGNTTTMHRVSGRDTCIGGWVRSGDWWLHCGFCRPYGGSGPTKEHDG